MAKSKLPVDVNTSLNEVANIDPNLVVNVTTGVVLPPQGPGILASCFLSVNAYNSTNQPVNQFTSANAVGLYYGFGSLEYTSAVEYFKGTDQSASVPPYLYIAGYFPTTQAPFMRGSALQPNNTQALANILALGNTNSFSVVINGTKLTATNVAISGLTSLSAVASAVATALNAVTPAPSPTTSVVVSFNPDINSFFLQTAQALDTIAFDPTPVAGSLNDLLFLSQSTGAILSAGINAALTPAQNMNNIVDNLLDTANIIPISALGDTSTGANATYLALAAWNSTIGNNRFAFLFGDSLIAETISPDTTSLQALITSNNYANSSVFYAPSLANAISYAILAGTVFASADYTQPNSALTACFKSQEGLVPSVTNTAIAKVLLAKGTNFYGAYGLSVATFNFLQPGAISGEYKFIDNLMAAIWLTRNIQLNIFNLLTAVGEVVNDRVGYGQIYDQIVNVLQANIANGVIAQGQDLSAYAQEVQSKYGVNVNLISNNGWYIISTPANAAQRTNRTTPTWLVLYVKGDAIQSLPISIIGLN
jgi:hypothetical protein